MKVTLIADSTFLFEHAGLKILTDPWIGTSIYGGAWLQYPQPKISAKDVGHLDYIFISHIHEDHCDPATLTYLDKNASIVIMDRKPNFVENFLRKENFNFKSIIKLKSQQKFYLAENFSIEVIEADPRHELSHLLDSSLIFHWDDKSIYFGNDNHPYPELNGYLKQLNLVLAIMAASGGSGYPACFHNLTQEEKETEKKRVVKKYFDEYASALCEISPKRFTASAGNHILSGKSASRNKDMTFLESPMKAYQYAYSKFSEEQRNKSIPVPLQEGDTWDADTWKVHDSNAEWSRAMCDDGWAEAKNNFIEEIASKNVYEHDNIELPDSLDWGQLGLEAAKNASKLAKINKIFPTTNLYLRLGDSGKWAGLDCETLTPHLVQHTEEFQQPYLKVACDLKLMYRLLTGDFSPNIADAAGFLDYHRVPNHYDHKVVIVLNYFHLPKFPCSKSSSKMESPMEIHV